MDVFFSSSRGARVAAGIVRSCTFYSFVPHRSFRKNKTTFARALLFFTLLVPWFEAFGTEVCRTEVTRIEYADVKDKASGEAFL